MVRAVYQISYMTCSEYIRNEHVPMVYDDNSCSIEDGERRAYCFNQVSGINHLILRDDGLDDSCPWIPTRKRLVQGQFLTTKNAQAFISHSNKIYFEITRKNPTCDCDDTYETNSDNVLIRKISVVCSPLSTNNTNFSD